MTFRFCHIPVLIRAVFVALALLSIPSLSQADEEESKRLISAYVDATNAQDLDLLKKAWNDLNDNPEAVEYMKQKYPKIHYMFQVRGVYFQVDDIKIDEDEAPVNVPVGSEESKTQADHFSVSGPQSGRKLTNGEIVERSKSAVRRDNRDIAIGNPNQNRQANQELIQNRVQSYREQKFQDAPEVLVPTGEPQ